MEMPASFEEFWPYYVSQHRDPRCRWMHFAGTTLAMGCIAVSPMMPAAVFAAPVVGYGLSWIGHFAFERNKPASWGGLRAAAYSLRGDVRMWRYMLAGAMTEEVARLTDAPAPGTPADAAT
jgi:hypothetical protein